MNNKTIQQVEDYVKSIMSDEVAHDFKHVDRVKNWALQIASKENFEDLEVVVISALMHDIGLTQAEKRSLHGDVGAEMTVKFLTENNLLTQDKIVEICNAIKFHNKNREGEGKLLKILRDADMMDLFGAVGIMRAFTSKSSKPEYDVADIKGKTWRMKAVDFDKRFDNGVGIGNFIIDQINFQISCYDNLSTESARQFAKPLVEFMISYIKQLDAEINDGRNSV
ncbi:HD domain-containing protein [Patescibacteria group bacterium]|nr:HD domain-containing protein [Patescibacteria group bacterium]